MVKVLKIEIEIPDELGENIKLFIKYSKNFENESDLIIKSLEFYLKSKMILKTSLNEKQPSKS